MVDSAMGARLASCPQKARPRRRVRHVAVQVFEAAGFLALIAVAVLAYRLASGPIAIEWLRDRVAAGLQDRLGDRYSVELGPTYLRRDSWGVGLGFRDFRLKDRQGRIVLSAPRGRIGVDSFAAAFGDVKVRRLELDGLGLRLHVAADGSLSLAAAGDETAAPIALPSGGSGLESLNIAALIRAGAEAMAGAGQAVDRLTLANARFEIDNEATGRAVTYSDFNLVFDHSGDVGTAKISASGPVGRWTMEAQAHAGAEPMLSLEARDVSLADLETFDKKPPPLFAEGPIAFRIESRLDPNGAVASLTGRFTVGAGTVRLNNPDALPFLVDEASGEMSWNGGEKRLDVDSLTILAGESHFAAAGWVKPPEDAQGAWSAHLASTDARFGPERRGEKPVPLDSIVFEARFVPAESRFVIDNLAARGPTFDGVLKADIAPEGAGERLKLRLDLKPSVTQDAIRLWPQFINPDVRDWASHNMHGGKLEGVMIADWSPADLDAMAHKHGVAAESVQGTFATHDVGVDLLPGLPPILSGVGTGAFDGRHFKVEADRAVMDLGRERRILAGNLVFEIPDTSPREIVDATARAHLVGTADSLADLLSRDPLRKEAGIQIDPATVKGQAEGDLVLDLKLGKTVKPEDSGFHASGSVTNMTLDKFVGPEKLEQGSLAFVADRSSLTVTGEGSLFGSPARIDASRAPGDDGSATVTATLDQAQRVKRGLNLGWLSGPLPIHLKAPLSRASAEVEVDLTAAGIENPIPGVAKATGKPGKATFEIKPSTEGASVSNLAIDFGSVSMRGAAELGVDGSILSAQITQARLSPGDSLQAEVVNTAGGVKATVRGAAFDARPLISAMAEKSSASQATTKDFDLDMKVAAVTGANKQAIDGLELNFSRRGGADKLAFLKGRLGQGTLAAGRSEDGVLRVAASDAGAVAKFANLYTRMEGGDLDLALQTSGETSAGAATVTNFTLRDEPAFRRLMAAAPARGPGGEPDSQLARFQRMTIAFQHTPGELNIQDAVIYNPNMGLTTEGTVDFARNTIDVAGTFIPAYSVNNLLNKIPLVGTLLGGGQNEGVFGISYRAEGSLNDPKLTVNPLSAIAPGILRKILGVVDGTGSRSALPAHAATAPTPSTGR
jgi:hypothetical protein